MNLVSQLLMILIDIIIIIVCNKFMKWYLLQKNKCPKCGSHIELKFDDCIVKCSECDFRISEKRKNQILADLSTC